MTRPPANWYRDPRHLLSLGFGSGLAPVAPGTVGTLAAIPLFVLLAMLPLWGYAAAVVLAFGLGVAVCGHTSRQMGRHDHPAIVWDEFVGFWITMAAVPASPVNLLLGFVLFRGFDILKPWPIRWLDRRVKGGLGVMVDDALAGGLAALCLWLVHWQFGGGG